MRHLRRTGAVVLVAGLALGVCAGAAPTAPARSAAAPAETPAGADWTVARARAGLTAAWPPVASLAFNQVEQVMETDGIVAAIGGPPDQAPIVGYEGETGATVWTHSANGERTLIGAGGGRVFYADAKV